MEGKLLKCCENIIETNSTQYIYEFESLIQSCIKSKEIKDKATIEKCIKQLKNLIPSK
jgi:hypothetical protein